ncbi:MAG: DMT family transporter [Henriciella sp.]|nr:DMT family transporter [Henriciella sp.]
MAYPLRTFLLTALAMVSFAANSVLGRLGLVETEIGAGSFTMIRLLSGAIILVLLCVWQSRSVSGTWRGGLCLTIYAVCFSYSYLAIPAGTGAIILFALVQITMLSWGLMRGERLSGLQSFGFVLALAALVWLISPSIEAPPLAAAAAMAIAGIAWGVYSLPGSSSGADPTAATAGNFVRATLIAAPLLLIALQINPEARPPADGIALAVTSGAVTSGLGYAIWYVALKDLTATRAGIAQLTVPAIAAIGGVLFLAEPITVRFSIATLAILTGVALAVLTPAPGSSKALK